MKKIILVILLIHLLSMTTQAQEDTLPTLSDIEIITPNNTDRIEQIELSIEDVRHVSISPNGKLIAVVTQYQDYDYFISIRDFQTDNEISTMSGRMDSFQDLIWSPDSSRIAVISGRLTGGGVQERSVKTYTIALGSGAKYIVGVSDIWIADYIYPPAYPEPFVEGNPVDITWSSDSRMIAIALYERLLVYDVVEDKELFSADVPEIRGVEWSSDGRMIVTEGDRSAQLWVVKTS